jgi:hypothetical protein
MLTAIGEQLNARWGELDAVELLLDEFSEELERKDLLHPYVRAVLDGDRAGLREIAEELALFGVELVEGEPPAALVARLREIARKEIGR